MISIIASTDANRGRLGEDLMTKKISPLLAMLDAALEARLPDYQRRGELLSRHLGGEAVPAGQWRRYWGDIAPETAADALRIHYRRVMAPPDPQPSGSEADPLAMEHHGDGDVPMAVVPDASAPQPAPYPPILAPHPQPLPDRLPEPEGDSLEEKARKAKAKRAFRYWTALLKWKDEGGSGGNGSSDGGGWLKG